MKQVTETNTVWSHFESSTPETESRMVVARGPGERVGSCLLGTEFRLTRCWMMHMQKVKGILEMDGGDDACTMM